MNKCLGIVWSFENEKSFLAYSHWSEISDEAKNAGTLTRRIISSIVSKAFDPLGLASALVLPGKLALHYSWKEKDATWDSPIEPTKAKESQKDDIKNIFSSWKLFSENMEKIKTLKIPRYYFDGVRKGALMTIKEIHMSGDTALLSRCVHAILRAEFDNDEVHTSLVMATTKINPDLKGARISIPRLELTVLEEATMLGIKLKNLLNADRVIVCSDSKVSIAQVIRGHKFGCGTLKTFIANRVKKILDNISVENIWYVPTGETPSDIGTRPISA